MKKNIVKEIELYYPNVVEQPPVFIRNSIDASQVVFSVFNKNQLNIREVFVVIYLNRANQVLGSSCEFKGGITGVVVDPRLIFSIALKCLAVSIVVAHNHPSGNLKPSSEDEFLTNKIKDIGNLLDIQLLDHLIVNNKGEYYSFMDNGNIL